MPRSSSSTWWVCTQAAKSGCVETPTVNDSDVQEEAHIEDIEIDDSSDVEGSAYVSVTIDKSRLAALPVQNRLPPGMRRRERQRKRRAE